jgi:hypothetical protein
MALTEHELDFINQSGRFFARTYGAAPMTGRVMGWLLICDPPEQTAADIAEALGASRSAIGTAIREMEPWRVLDRIRVPGERAERVRVDPDFGMSSVESTDEYAGLAAIARRGLAAIAGSPPARRARLEGVVAFAEFLVERMPALAAEWRERQEALLRDREEQS